MAKQLNRVSVNLAFSADTSQAKSQMLELQKLLDNLGTHTAKNNKLGLDKELTSALEKASQLKAILASSTNSTGGLDLGKFSNELQKSGVQLKQYANDLVSLGPQGEQAFVQLARSISAAEVPLKRSNAMLSEFLVTLKNTARWQISSSIMHGFMGSVQKAYGYAEDLNRSLNDIRIVTGQTTSQMAQFAKEANKSAKALSTTTTAYSDAALIFYQQGLDDNAVKERTDAVIKMANVTRDSETEVSSYMTAIWNNFDGEKKNLEEYADVITALGAATASSSAEIAGGLEKFAAIGQQIGLSYDYATTALATVVANTRQSEEVVGTAFKTIFARIQGLSLGETLDDGTDLNKYSQALASVGISIKDATGELRDMDDILDDMGGKWQTLSRDQQVALAQTVAGVRQYNQLIALMDAWQTDFQNNLSVAQNSEGSLNEQSEIYAEGWEAARDRVRAAAEGLYDSLLDEDIFIKSLDWLEKLFTTVERLVDGLGGMSGVILTAGSLLFRYFGPDLANSINNMIYNMQISSEAGMKRILDLRKQANAELKATFNDSASNTGGMNTSTVKATVYAQEADLQDQLLLKNESLLRMGREMDEVEQKKLQLMLDENKALGEQAIKAAELATTLNTRNEDVNSETAGRFGKDFKNIKETDLSGELKAASQKEKSFMALSKVISNANKDQVSYGKNAEKLKGYLEKVKKAADQQGGEFTELSKSLEEVIKSGGTYDQVLQSLQTQLEELGGASQQAYDQIEQDTGALNGFSDALKTSQTSAGNAGMAFVETVGALDNVEQHAKKAGAAIDGAKVKAYTFGDGMSALGGAIMSTSMALNSLINLGSIWNNEDLSVGEKLLTTITTMGMVVPMLTQAYSKQNVEKIKSLGLTTKQIVLDKAKTLGLVGEAAGTEVVNAALTKEVILKTILQALDLKKLLITIAITAALVALAAIVMGVVKAFQAQAEAEARANENADKTKERYEALRTEFESLKSAIEDYDDSLNAFNQLRFGAEGYAEALEKVNEQARNLIETNGLYDDWYYGDNGEILFKDGALEGALSSANKQQLDANVTYNAAELKRQRVVQEGWLNDTDFYTLKWGGSHSSDKDGDGYINGGAYYDETKPDEVTYMSTDDIVNALATLPAEQYELLKNSGITSQLYDYTFDYDEATGEYIQTYKEQVEQLAQTMGMTVDEVLILSDSISEMGDDADKTIEKLKQYKSQQDYYREQEALAGVQKQGLYSGDSAAQIAYANLLAQNEDYIKKSNENADEASDANEKDIKALLAKRDDKWSNYNDGWGKNGTLTDEELMQAYAQYVEGWTKEQLDKSNYDGGNGKGTLTSGDLSLENLNDDYMREALQSKLLADQLAANKGSDGKQIYDDSEIKQAVEAVMKADSDIQDTVMNALANYQDGEALNLNWSLISPEEAEKMKALAGEMGDTYGTAVEEALKDYDPAQYFEAQEAMQNRNIDDQIAASELDPDVIATQTELIQANTEALEGNENAAKQLAVNNARMNKGMKTLIDNWKDWKKVLNDGDKNTTEYAETITSLKDVMGDLVGLSDDMAQSLSADFFDSAENLELLEKAANADAEAVAQLGFEVGKNLISNLEATYSVLENGKIEVFDGETFNSIDELEARMNTLSTNINGYMTDIQTAVADGSLGVGDSLANAIGQDDMAALVSSLNEMARYTQMSVEDMQALLNSMGVEANVDVQEIDVNTSVPRYRTTFHKDGSLIGFATGASDLEITSQTHVDGYENVTEKKQVASIAYDGSNPKANIRYVGHGGASKGNQSAAEEAAKKGSKKNNTQEEKDVKKETDRYHVIKNQLEDVTSELEAISKAKDRAFGPKKLKLMDAEIAKTEELIKKNQEYLRQIKENYNQERTELAKFGAAFDENGTIANYDALIQAAVDKYNAAVQEFNKHTTDDEAAKAAFKVAEEEYAKFKELIAQYEEDQDLIKEIEQEIQDQKDAIFDAKLEKIEYVIDIKLDVEDRDLKHLEFLLEMIEDKDFHAAEAIANLGLQTQDYLDQIETYKKGIQDILDLGGFEGSVDDFLNGNHKLEDLDLTEDALETLEDYIDGLAETNEALREMRENAWAQVSDEFDEYLEKMDDGIEKIEHLKNITQSYQNIVSIVGKKFLGVSNDLMDKMSKSMVTQSQDLLAANKAKMEALQASYDQLLSEDTTGWSDQALKERQELLDKMKGELQGAKEAFMSSWEEALQASADHYAKIVDSIIEQFEDKIAGLYGTLDELQEAYDRASDLDAQYLEDYEQIYQLTKLTRDINNSIDDTDNIASKQAYKELIAEINQIEAEGTKLSEYDLEVLQKKFELKQAELALKEAENAKSSVNMVRGEDGNYSYVYTANEDDVATAEQNYEDKLHEMQVLNGEYINSLQEQIIQTQAECAQALAAIKESDFNSYEEWRAAVDRTQAYYDQKMDFYYSQLDRALGNNRDLYENDWAAYSALTGYKISADENYVDKFTETNYSIITGFGSIEEAHVQWNNASYQLLNELSAAYMTWQAEVEATMGLAGSSVEGFADTMERETDKNVDNSRKTAEAVQDMGEQMKTTFSETLSAMAEWEATWGRHIDAAIAKNNEMIASYNAMKAAMADSMSSGGGSGSSGGSGSNGPGGGGSSGSGGDGVLSPGDTATYTGGTYYHDSYGTAPSGNRGPGKKVTVTDVKEDGRPYPIHVTSSDSAYGWLKRSQLSGYDTGGYTGDWGDTSGRLALLHQKEIVLNADDTKNFLSAIEMVRQIATIIDLNAAAASGAYNSLNSATNVHTGEQEMIQQIEIHAEFPDATDHSEIEMAFQNLINTASQYANRNNR